MRTMPPLLTGIAALALGSVAAADVVTLSAARDNTLYENDNDQDPPPSNGAGRNLYAGRSNQGAGQDRKRIVIAFDLAPIPAGSTINSVTLSLYMNRSNEAGNTPVAVHRLLADWGEAGSSAGGGGGGGADAEVGDATWRHRFYPTDFWAPFGGEYVAASATTTVGTAEQFYDWSSGPLAADVQGWLDSPATNHGWIVVGDESAAPTAKRYSSREANQSAERPKLTIDYTPGVLEGACCDDLAGCTFVLEQDCLDAGGEFLGSGVLCIPNPCTIPLGACCFGDGSCLELTEADCGSQGGLYEGDDTLCDPNPCPQPTGACCLLDGVCDLLTETDCITMGGAYQGDNEPCTPCLCPVVLTPYLDPLPVPPELPPDSPGGTTYTITMTEFQQQLHSELAPTTVWGYAGTYPGRTIEATRDVPITVNWVNSLPATHYLPVDTCAHGADDDSTRTVVHLHGGHVPPDADGYPEDAFATGGSLTYVYPNNQLPATLWYHDHALGITRLNVYMGLAGFYLLRDQVELDIGLPSGAYEIPMVIQDRSFNPDGSWCYPSQWQDHFYGNQVLVNGKVQPFLDVEQATYRLRLLNGSNTRTYTLSFSNGASFDQIGSDGGLFEHPVTGLTEITLGPGERVDILIDFTPYANTAFILENSEPPHGDGAPLPEIMKFVVTGVSGPVVATPDPLRPLEILQTDDSKLERFFTMRKVSEPCAGSHWLINDLGWDDITEFPRLDTIETWSFVNLSGMMHPMHIHLVMFQVVNRQTFTYDGVTVTPTGDPIPPEPTEVGWKDTVRAEPGLITRVIARFEDYTGLYAYHCHILEHEDHEMMRQFQALPACPWDCVGNDDEIGIDEFLAVLGLWGDGHIDEPCDFDGDGTVGIDEFLAVLGLWGPCPQ